MLVTFSCPAYADITMFGGDAIRLIKMMGHSGDVPSALLADDIPAALTRLKAAIAVEQAASQPAAAKGDSDEPAVSLSHRAMPLIDLLTAAAKEGDNVMWDKNS